MIPTLPIIFLALFSSAQARPNLQRRGLPGGVYTCTGKEFSGDCQWTEPTDRCRVDGGGNTGNDLLSIGPDEGTTCTLYKKNDCTGDKIETLQFPGVGTGFAEFASFKCVADASSGSSSRLARRDDSEAMKRADKMPSLADLGRIVKGMITHPRPT